MCLPVSAREPRSILSMKSLFLRIAILPLAVAIIAGPLRSQEILDGVAAVVNGDVITYSQVRELVGAREQAARQMLSGSELVDTVKKLRESALQDLIDRQLVLQEFNKKGFQVPDYVLEDRIDEIIREDFGGDRSAFLRTLNAQGYTLSRFRQIEMEKLKVQAMRQNSLNSKLVIPPRRIQEYYREHIRDYTVNAQLKLRMIVIPQVLRRRVRGTDEGCRGTSPPCEGGSGLRGSCTSLFGG